MFLLAKVKRSCTFITVITQIRTSSLNSDTSNKNFKTKIPWKDYNIYIYIYIIKTYFVFFQEKYKTLVEMSTNNTTGNLLGYFYHQNFYKFNGIDLSRQVNVTISPQINFTQKFEEENGETILTIAEKQNKIFLSFSLDSLIVTE